MVPACEYIVWVFLSAYMIVISGIWLEINLISMCFLIKNVILSYLKIWCYRCFGVFPEMLKIIKYAIIFLANCNNSNKIIDLWWYYFFNF